MKTTDESYKFIVDGHITRDINGDHCVLLSRVMEYCLDRKKVREIIDKHWKSTKEHPAIDGNYLFLIKELNL